jgi:hypothetical protein
MSDNAVTPALEEGCARVSERSKIMFGTRRDKSRHKSGIPGDEKLGDLYLVIYTGHRLLLGCVPLGDDDGSRLWLK